MLKVKSLTVKFDKKIVLSNINAAFEAGNIHGIIGLDGSGKTTFF